MLLGLGLEAGRRQVAQRLDLGRGFHSAVGDDLFQNPDARLELGIAGGILSGLLDRNLRLDLQLLLRAA